MTADFRALCVELTDCLEKALWPLRHRYVFQQWIDIARAALADEPAVLEGREPASVTGQPSDEEIMGLMPQQMHEDLAYAARAMANEAGTDNRKAKGFMRIALNRHAVDLARAVLARWGNKVPAPLANGDVGELIGKLVEAAPALAEMGWDQHAQRILRAAELLQRQVLVPVSVSERLPGPEDCDAEWRCWWAHEADKDIGIAGKWVLLRFRGKATVYTHWLPAHALPVPQQQENTND